MPPRRAVPGDTTDPEAMPALVGEFCEWLLVRGYSKATADGYYVNLVLLAEWLAERGICRPIEVTRPVLEGYQRALFHLRQPNGRPLKHRTQLARLVATRRFFRWLAHGHRILYNPAAELELPRVPRWTPRAAMTVAEVEDVMAAVDVDTVVGVRDRAILEVFYSTGIRGAELGALTISDLDVVSGTLMVNAGKGGRARMVPIGERAIAWCEKYLTGSRPNLAVPPDDNWLFLADRGGPFTGKRLTALVSRYLRVAGITKGGACHLFRHTAATLMLDGGADIRHVQALLGHAELTTTQIYTQVSIRALKAVHTATHPGATTNSRARPERGLTESALGSRLFAALAAEADQDDELGEDFDLDDDDLDLDENERPAAPERPLRRQPPRRHPMSTQPDPVVCELRLIVDTDQLPLAWAEHAWPSHQPEQLAVDIAGPGVAATLVVPIGEARAWAGELFSAVAVAYREATGDPHALTDYELASLGDPNAYDPGPGVLAVGEDDDTPARVRFHIAVDICGRCLSTADLRAALVEHVAGRFNVARVAVSAGDVLAGRTT